MSTASWQRRVEGFPRAAGDEMILEFGHPQHQPGLAHLSERLQLTGDPGCCEGEVHPARTTLANQGHQVLHYGCRMVAPQPPEENVDVVDEE